MAEIDPLNCDDWLICEYCRALFARPEHRPTPKTCSVPCAHAREDHLAKVRKKASKIDDRRRRALARLEAHLAPTLVLPLVEEQAEIWRKIILLRRKLGLLNDVHLAIERALR